MNSFFLSYLILPFTETLLLLLKFYLFIFIKQIAVRPNYIFRKGFNREPCSMPSKWSMLVFLHCPPLLFNYQFCYTYFHKYAHLYYFKYLPCRIFIFYRRLNTISCTNPDIRITTKIEILKPQLHFSKNSSQKYFKCNLVWFSFTTCFLRPPLAFCFCKPFVFFFIMTFGA